MATVAQKPTLGTTTIHQLAEQTVAGNHQGPRANRLAQCLPKGIETPGEGKPPTNRHVPQ